LFYIIESATSKFDVGSSPEKFFNRVVSDFFKLSVGEGAEATDTNKFSFTNFIVPTPKTQGGVEQM
jgi:hypothetical protein